MAIINGTSGNDTIIGTANPDTINLFGGNDIAFGGGGDDVVVGYDGDDTVEGGAGADELFGSNGFDFASYRGSNAGVYVGLSFFEFAGGHAEGDHLYSIEGVIGSAYADSLYGDEKRNVLRGEGGSDVLAGFEGDDLLVGGSGNDDLLGGLGADELRGGAGNDVLFGDSGADALSGGSGIDIASYFASTQAVRIDLAAGKGFGGDAEGDRLSGIEAVLGSALNDRLTGNDVANRLAGNTGADTMAGGGGADWFFYLEASDSTAALPDRILDFRRAQGDKIVVGTMDANDQVDGHQAFTFIGQGQFTGAGQLRFSHADGGTVIQGNLTDATAGAELVIVLNGLINLRASDFIFENSGFFAPAFD